MNLIFTSLNKMVSIFRPTFPSYIKICSYRSMKSCVFKDGKKSEFFSSNIGVRQGENLSSFLFALFINDIEEYFQQKGSSHLNFNSPELAN